MAATAASSQSWFPWWRSQVAPPAPPDVRRSGLVSDWDDAFYGLALPNPIAAGELLLTPGLLWAAAEMDAAAANMATNDYLARVRKSAAALLDDKEADGLPRVVNHDGTLAALRGLGEFDGKGKLLLLTGPRSVGKSLMLEKMTKELGQQRCRVVYIDARQCGPDLTRGVIAALAADPPFFDKFRTALAASSGILVEGMFAAAAEFAQAVPSTPKRSAASAAVGSVTAATEATAKVSASPHPLDHVLGAFFTACKDDGQYPVIFIDEANKAFKAAQGDEDAVGRVLDELDLFTRITTQTREASMVLATSEHGLPFRLRALGYNTEHISETILAEEVPPTIMKGELCKWGCGEHLATALLSMYGGHLLHTAAAVRKLATSTAPAAMEGIAAMGKSANAPTLSLDDDTFNAAGVPPSAWPEMRTHVTEALRTLVTDGFVPLDSPKDKVAEIISLANAGCVISRVDMAAGLPPRVWQSRSSSDKRPKDILVPSSHTMRLIIASEVFPRRSA